MLLLIFWVGELVAHGDRRQHAKLAHQRVYCCTNGTVAGAGQREHDGAVVIGEVSDRRGVRRNGEYKTRSFHLARVVQCNVGDNAGVGELRLANKYGMSLTLAEKPRRGFRNDVGKQSMCTGVGAGALCKFCMSHGTDATVWVLAWPGLGGEA